jgi:hypothetical protein
MIELNPKRETRLVLDSALAIHTACQTAVHDDFVIRRVRMARPVHNALAVCWTIRDADEAMQKLKLYYDPIPKSDMKDGEPCGTFLGKPVVIDDTLKRRLMILESTKVTLADVAAADAACREMRKSQDGSK